MVLRALTQAQANAVAPVASTATSLASSVQTSVQTGLNSVSGLRSSAGKVATATATATAPAPAPASSSSFAMPTLKHVVRGPTAAPATASKPPVALKPTLRPAAPSVVDSTVSETLSQARASLTGLSPARVPETTPPTESAPPSSSTAQPETPSAPAAAFPETVSPAPVTTLPPLVLPELNSTRSVTLDRGGAASIGFSIVGGGAMPITISKITAGSPAAASGNLFVGDQVSCCTVLLFFKKDAGAVLSISLELFCC
jgi:hypothetical protein